MVQIHLIPRKSVTYYFVKSKDLSMEDGLKFITLFAKLACEITYFAESRKHTQVETLWVQAKDVQLEQANKKVKEMSNCMVEYEVSQELFQHLLYLAQNCPNELYEVIPYYKKVTREMFIPWDEIEQSWQNR